MTIRYANQGFDDLQALAFKLCKAKGCTHPGYCGESIKEAEAKQASESK